MISTIIPSLPKYALYCGLTWIIWKLFRRKLINSPLDNIPGPVSQSLLLGNLRQYYSRNGWDFHMYLAQYHQPVVRLHGFSGAPWLHVADEKALHTILIKDEQIFEESPTFIKTNVHLFGPGLLATEGEIHRKQRKILNPVFSVAHMRHMLPIFYKIGYSLREGILGQVNTGVSEVDIVSWMGRVALELIGQGGLGESFDPLVSGAAHDTNVYGSALKSIFPLLADVGLLWNMMPFVDGIGPSWFRRQVIANFPSSNVRKLAAAVDTLARRALVIYEGKKAAIRQGDPVALQQLQGKDIMTLLLKANSAVTEEDRLSETELIAQITTLVFAAVDTTSNTICRILHLLSEHQDIQDRLRAEVREAYEVNDELSYDRLMQLPLLDAVCRETLRRYPQIMLSGRVPNRDTIVPLAHPIRGLDGTMINEIHVPKGTQVSIGVLASNTNKAWWGEDALEWKPDRWLAALPAALNEAAIPGVSSKLMTFLGGKRACIGFKFAEMEMKVVLSILIATFLFEPTDKRIVWNIAPVIYPSVEVESSDAKMLLRVSLAPGMRHMV